MADASLYDRDFYAWTRQQVELLRRLRDKQGPVELDAANLLKEVVDLGYERRRRTEGRIRRIVTLLLHLEHSPLIEPRAEWRGEVGVLRLDVDEDFEDSGALRAALDPARLYAGVHRRLLVQPRTGGVDWKRVLKPECPWTLEQILDHGWWPRNRHGLQDR